MSRTKVSKPGSGKLPKASSKVSSDRITKSTDTPKAKSSKIGKDVVAKLDKKQKKKVHKEPTPSSDSDSSSVSSSSSASSAEDTSGAESDVSDTAGKPDAKVNGAAKPVANGAAAKSGSTSSGSESASESESDSSKASEDEAPTKSSKPAAMPKASSKQAAEAQESDSSSDSESDSDSEGEPPAAKVVNAANGADVANDDNSSAASDNSSEGSESSSGDSDSAESDSGAESDEESEAEAGAEPAGIPVKKRKAESVEAPVQKKVKVDETSAPGATKTLFIGNLSWNVDDEMLRSEFESFGELVRSTVMTHRDSGKSKGFGFVEFTTAGAAAKAHDAKKDQDLDGRPMNVDFTGGKSEGGPPNRQDRVTSRAKSFSDQMSKPSNILFCGNLSFGMTSDKLREVFETYGTITRAALPTDRETGQLKGYGYVDFTTVDEAKAAVEALNGSDIDGRAVRLDFANPRPENAGGGRGRGDFGGRGRSDFGGRGGRGGRGGDRGGRGGGRGSRGGPRGGRISSTNQGGLGDFSGTKTTF